MIITEIVELIAKLIMLAIVILSTLMFIFAAVLAIDDMLEEKVNRKRNRSGLTKY